jgi:hypothetical protein
MKIYQRFCLKLPILPTLGLILALLASLFFALYLQAEIKAIKQQMDKAAQEIKQKKISDEKIASQSFLAQGQTIQTKAVADDALRSSFIQSINQYHLNLLELRSMLPIKQGALNIHKQKVIITGSPQQFMAWFTSYANQAQWMLLNMQLQVKSEQMVVVEAELIVFVNPLLKLPMSFLNLPKNIQMYSPFCLMANKYMPLSTVPSNRQRFALDQFKYRGFLQLGKKKLALLSTPNANTLQVEEGQYLGKERAKVITIEVAAIQLKDAANHRYFLAK